MSAELRDELDFFYWHHGLCCAGCDHWQPLNALVGDCEQLAANDLASEVQHSGASIYRITSAIVSPAALTERGHLCQAFVDSFPWQAMPPPYLERIGAERWHHSGK